MDHAKNPIANISLIFDSESKALYKFNQEIGSKADDLDRSDWLELILSLETTLGLSAGEILKTAEKSSPNLLAQEFGEQLQGILTDPTNPKFEKAKAIFAWVLKAVHKISPHGQLLRRGVLSNITTHFEVLLGRICKEYYNRYPGALESSDRSLKLIDLRECGSIESAENLLIEHEIDTLLFKPLDEQLDAVTRKLALPKDLFHKYEDQLLEIFLRRNLFVHNLGIVNRQYLQKVPSTLSDIGTVKEGDQLLLLPKYLDDATDNVFIAGVILLQTCWRKWAQKEEDLANSLLHYHVYESLRDHRYSPVIDLASFGIKDKSVSDLFKKTLMINKAIAFRETGRKEELDKILKDHDWSAASLKFTLAIAVLENDKAKIFPLIKKALAINEITKFDLKEWPLFDPIREEAEFKTFLN